MYSCVAADSLPYLKSGEIKKGLLVAFRSQEDAEKMIRERKYLRDGGYLMKYIVGEKGDSVCTDKCGRQWRGYYVIFEGQFTEACFVKVSKKEVFMPIQKGSLKQTPFCILCRLA